MFALLFSLLTFPLVGAAVYEAILWRKKRKYQNFQKMIADGVLAEMPKGYEKEPTRLTGLVYVLAIVGIGMLTEIVISFLAYGACMVVFMGSGMF